MNLTMLSWLANENKNESLRKKQVAKESPLYKFKLAALLNTIVNNN
jgi:hypothetical protein